MPTDTPIFSKQRVRDMLDMAFALHAELCANRVSDPTEEAIDFVVTVDPSRLWLADPADDETLSEWAERSAAAIMGTDDHGRNDPDA